MKRLWIAVTIVMLMLAGSLVNAWYAQSLTDGMTEQLAQAQELVRQERWEQAADLTQEIYQRWQDHHFYLHSVLRHSDTDQILRGFRAVIQYLDIQEMDQYSAANIDLIAQLELLSEMEQASLVNVL